MDPNELQSISLISIVTDRRGFNCRPENEQIKHAEKLY
jgi:hypothetical protein